jgi:hypothetical protein
MAENDDSKAQAILDYLDAYRAWNRARIDSEESTIEMVESARRALSTGVTLREIKDARLKEDAKAERMTSFD